jgi:hypothetical protein
LTIRRLSNKNRMNRLASVWRLISHFPLVKIKSETLWSWNLRMRDYLRLRTKMYRFHLNDLPLKTFCLNL